MPPPPGSDVHPLLEGNRASSINLSRHQLGLSCEESSNPRHSTLMHILVSAYRSHDAPPGGGVSQTIAMSHSDGQTACGFRLAGERRLVGHSLASHKFAQRV